MEDEDAQPLLSSDLDGSDDYVQPNDDSRELPRNLISFWMIGLCNNFGYVVMLSAAFDILKDQSKGNVDPTHNTTFNVLEDINGVKLELTKNYTGFHCNPISTGLVLLADIIPSLLIKLTAPYYMLLINYHIRIAFVIITLIMSLLTVAFSPSVIISIIGVVLASISSGFGEITFLSLSTHFKPSTVASWSSGTGMAGVTGAVAYAGLLQIGLSKRNTLLFLLLVPSVWAAVVWMLLKFPSNLKFPCRGNAEEEIAVSPTISADKTKNMSLKMKIELLLPLKKYMVPLFLVYVAEYTINQGLYELLYYDISWLNQAEQYRWFQVCYQIAVFISRSSVYLFQIKKIIILSVCQWLIFLVLLLEVRFTFIPSIWIVMAIIFLEGLFGGAVYVNAFFMISKEIESDVREFSIGAASLGDSLGVSIAAGISIPIHDALCKLKKT